MKDSIEDMNEVVSHLANQLQETENNMGGLHVSLQSAVYEENMKLKAKAENAKRFKTNAPQFA